MVAKYSGDTALSSNSPRRLTESMRDVKPDAQELQNAPNRARCLLDPRDRLRRGQQLASQGNVLRAVEVHSTHVHVHVQDRVDVVAEGIART